MKDEQPPLKVVKPFPEESEESSKSQSSLPKSNSQPLSSEVSSTKKVVKKKKAAKVSKPAASQPTASNPSKSKAKSPQDKSLSKSPQKSKSLPAVYHLVIATLGKHPRLEVCSTIEEVAAEVKRELHASVPTDIRMWLLDGVLLPIPKVGEFDVDLSVIGREGSPLKVFQPSEDADPDADALDGIIIEADVGNLAEGGDVDNDNDSEFDDFDDDFNF